MSDGNTRIQRRSIPPASPHHAGHYSGLHPEDQPYQSSIMSVQRPPAPEQPAASARRTRSLAQQAPVPEVESPSEPGVDLQVMPLHGMATAPQGTRKGLSAPQADLPAPQTGFPYYTTLARSSSIVGAGKP